MNRFCVFVLMTFFFHAAVADNCKVAIDIGHTKEAYGATSARGVGEWYFNAALARKLAETLKQQGIPYLLINPEGESIPLTRRPDTAMKSGATLFISIHHDSTQPRYFSEWEWEGKKQAYSDLFEGYSLFVSEKNWESAESTAVARSIADSLLKSGLKPTLHHAEPIAGENRPLLDKERGIYQFDDLIVLRESRMAAVLVEAGVIINRQEELKVSTPAYQGIIVQAITSAAKAHCSRVK